MIKAEVKNKFDIGDKVRVVEYGHLMWIIDIDGNTKVKDVSPELVGKEGIVYEVNFCQGRYSYALKRMEGKTAWYDEKQLEMVNMNPNNE